MLDDSLKSEPKLSSLFAKNTIQTPKPKPQLEEETEADGYLKKASQDVNSGLKKIWDQCKPRKKEAPLPEPTEKTEMLEHLKRSYDLNGTQAAAKETPSFKRPLLPLDNDQVSTKVENKPQLPNPEEDTPGYQDLLYRYKKLQLHYSISQILLKVGLSLNAQLQEITCLLAERFSLWQCHVFLVEDKDMSCAASFSRHAMDFLTTSPELAVPVGKEAQLTKAIKNKRDILSQNKQYQHYSLPITHQKEVQGIIDLYYSPSHTLTVEERLTLRTISAQLSSFLEEYGKYQETQSQAHRDGLTGLYNHRYFQEQMDLLLRDAYLNNEWLSVAFFDLDFFKKLNDTHGHLTGDQALKHAAQCLQKHLRHGDVAARYGGEEFVVAFPKTSLEQARKLTEAMRKEIQTQALVTEKKEKINMTASAGVASLRKPDQEQKSHLLSMADQALYQAKEKGRNQVQTYILKIAPADVKPSPKKKRHWAALLKDKTSLFQTEWDELAKSYGATEATETVWRLKSLLPDLMQFLIAHLDQKQGDFKTRFEKVHFIPAQLKTDIKKGKSDISLISVEIALVLLGDSVNNVVKKLAMSESDQKTMLGHFDQMIALLNEQFQTLFDRTSG